MIRVAILADTRSHAAALAQTLRSIHDIEVVSIGTGASGLPMGVDVIVGDRLDAHELPVDSPPAVLIRDDASAKLPTQREVRAVLPPDVSPAELHAAIIAAAHELTVLTPVQAHRWLSGVQPALSDEEDDAPPVEHLTQRESEVLRLLADGLGNKEIAARLAISDHTAKFHVAQILAKFGAVSRAEAVAIGIRRGLVPV